jgi:hypothetical protein
MHVSELSDFTPQLESHNLDPVTFYPMEKMGTSLVKLFSHRLESSSTSSIMIDTMSGKGLRFEIRIRGTVSTGRRIASRVHRIFRPVIAPDEIWSFIKSHVIVHSMGVTCGIGMAKLIRKDNAVIG